MTTDQIKYSFIIPAYNAEKTIRRAVESIVKRMTRFEIIVVENGSTDGTAEILEALKRNHQQIKVIHTGKGVSKARNAGIEAAAGEWLAFVDADDLWEADEERLSSLCSISPEIDLLVLSYLKDKRPITHNYENSNTKLEAQEIGGLLDWMMHRPTTRMTVWGKLYRRAFLSSNKIYFNEQLRVSEDAEYLVRVLLQCKSAMVSDYAAYRFCVDTESTTRSIDPARTAAYIKALEAVENDLGKNPTKAYRDFVVEHINLICVHDIYNCEEKRPLRARRQQVKDLLEYRIIRQTMDHLTISAIRDIHYLPAYFFSKHLYELGGAICYLRSMRNRTGMRQAVNEYRKQGGNG